MQIAVLFYRFMQPRL